MKITTKSIGTTAWVILTIALLNAWSKARWELAHVNQRMVEVQIVDEQTAQPVINFTVDLPPLLPQFRTDLQQHLILRPERGFFVIAQVGYEPLRATVRAPGYSNVEMDLGSYGFKSEPVVIRMKKTGLNDSD